ncbi:hypothetical protein ACHAWX_004584 [Stephanocyclus meneghinianus]
MADEARAPFSIEGYSIGDEGKPHHFVASTSREEAAKEASNLRVGDAAFIKRSDLKWTYAIVTERTVNDNAVTLRFEVDTAKNRKSFPENQWGKYIRVITIKDEPTIAPPVAAAAAPAAAPAVTDDKSVHSVEKSVKSAHASVKSAQASVKAAKATAKNAISSDSSVKSGRGSVKGTVKGAIKSAIATVSSKADKSEKAEAVPAPVKEEKPEEKKPEEDKKEEEQPAKEESEKEETAKIPTEAAPVEPTVEVNANEQDAAKEKKADEPKVVTVDKTAANTPAIETKPSGGWFSSLFGNTKQVETPKAETAAAVSEVAPTKTAKTVETPAPIETPAPVTTIKVPVTATTTPGAPIEESCQPNPALEDEKSAKENYPEASDQLTLPKTFLPSPSLKGGLTAKRNPASILNFKFGNKGKAGAPKPVDVAPRSPTGLSIGSLSMPASPAFSFKSPMASYPEVPTSPKGKEWFDPEATECDYDKNPTDLFQALEAREFEYAFEMYEQTNEQFTKDCKTWVIAKGVQKGQQLRFRALPLHAAIVFDAPDELIIKILRAYPKATRGRDVKGRLPIHLAYEHQASEQIIALIIDAFPKGFFAKDKKEMTPLDHINGNTSRAYLARYIPQIIAAKIEEEREKWNVEANMLLEHQKATLKNNEEFMAEVIQHVQEEVEAHNMSKIELLEANYQKEIELLKRKHDSETQALLEGFEVKLNFERKLNKLKAKQ